GLGCDIHRPLSGGQAGEVAGALSERWHGPGIDAALPYTLEFLPNKKEQFALVGVEFLRNVHRAADIPTKIIEPQLSRARRIEGARVKPVVADEFVRRPMECLGAGLQRHVNYRAGVLAVLRAIVGGHYFELRQGLGIDIDELIAAASVVLIVNAIDVPGKLIVPGAV